MNVTRLASLAPILQAALELYSTAYLESLVPDIIRPDLSMSPKGLSMLSS